MWLLAVRLLVVIAVTTSVAAGAAEKLRILAWSGYADPEVVSAFEKISGARVEVSYVNSDDELWDKINKNKGGNYDVFAVNTAELQRYIDKGLTVPLDISRIPNHAHQLPRFQRFESIPALTRNGKVFAIPFTYSEMGLIYDRKKVKQVPQSMAAMWDPNYRGRVLAFNASNHNFSIAALLMGAKNPFVLNDKELEAAAKKLVQLRRNVLTFYTSPEDAVKLFMENDIALVYANYGTQQLQALREAGADVGYIIPREGALAWLDCWVITSGASNQKLAAQWINYTLEKKVSDGFSTRHGLANTVTPYPENKQSDKIIWLEPLESYARRNTLWNRILSGDSMEKF